MSLVRPWVRDATAALLSALLISATSMIGNSIANLAKSIQVLALVEDILGEIAAPALFAPVEEGNGARKQPQTLPGAPKALPSAGVETHAL